MRQAYEVSRAAIAKLISVQSQVESRIIVFVEKTEARMSCNIGEVSQRLEQSLEAVASGTIVVSAYNTHATIEGLSIELQAKFNQD